MAPMTSVFAETIGPADRPTGQWLRSLLTPLYRSVPLDHVVYICTAVGSQLLWLSLSNIVYKCVYRTLTGKVDICSRLCEPKSPLFDRRCPRTPAKWIESKKGWIGWVRVGGG